MSTRPAKSLTWIGAAALLGLLAVGTALAAPPARARASSRPTAAKPANSPILAVVVTDRVPQAGDGQVLVSPLALGPFVGSTTTDLTVVTAYDRRLLGIAPFDQVVTLTLPDGNRYSRRVIPTDPAAASPVTTSRPDVSITPVRVQSAPRMKRLARALPAGTVSEAQMREAVYTTHSFPVSGTWITKHNLYGGWSVTVEVVRDNRVVATATSKFEILGR